MKRIAFRVALGLFTAIFSVFVTGCALTLNLHANRFQSPEAEGQVGSGHVNFAGIHGANELVIVPNTTATPPSTQSPRFARMAANYTHTGAVGLAPRLDLELRNPLSDTGNLGLKYQLIGDPWAIAKKGNFSLSVAGGLYYANPSNRDEDLITHRAAKSDRTLWTYDAAVILGYRAGDNLLIYGGSAITQVIYEGSIDQTLPPSTSVSHYTFGGRAQQLGFHVGVRWEIGRGHILIEEAYAIAKATQVQDTRTDRAYTAIAGGVSW